MDKFKNNNNNNNKNPHNGGGYGPVGGEYRTPMSMPSAESSRPHDFMDFTEEPHSGLTGLSLDNDVCLNTTGIVVALAMFVIFQIVLAVVANHFWLSRRKKSLKEKEEERFVTSMFNPYAIRRN